MAESKNEQSSTKFEIIQNADVEQNEGRSQATIRLTIYNFSKFGGKFTSPSCYVQYLPWVIMVNPSGQKPDNHLSFYLKCMYECQTDCRGSCRSNWYCHAEAELRLLSHQHNVKQFSRKFKEMFSSKMPSWGYGEFMKWNDILDPTKGFIINNSIILEVSITAGVANGLSEYHADHIGFYKRENIISIPNTFLTSRRCIICKGLLSIPPIIITDIEGLQMKCGRCQAVKTDFNIRNILFEEIAQYAKFSCSFPNCRSTFSWNKPLKNHELVCPHRTVTCPSLNCYEIMKTNLFKSHFLKMHPQITFENNDFEIELNPTMHTEVGCITKSNKTFIIFLKWELVKSKILHCSVLSLSPTEMKYDLMICSKKGKIEKIIISDQKIETFDDNLHCSKCLFKKGACRSPYHNEKPYRYDTITKVSLKNKELLSHWITSSQPVILSVAIKIENSQLLENLKCPVCLDFLQVPILTCKTGHSICHKCRQGVQRCPLCQSAYDGSKNFSLEAIIDTIEVPCANKSKGCKFIATIKSLREHEKKCLPLE